MAKYPDREKMIDEIYAQLKSIKTYHYVKREQVSNVIDDYEKIIFTHVTSNRKVSYRLRIPFVGVFYAVGKKKKKNSPIDRVIKYYKKKQDYFNQLLNTFFPK